MTSTHVCDGVAAGVFPVSVALEDGQRWKCSCGRVWVYCCDEAEQGCWVPEKETRGR